MRHTTRERGGDSADVNFAAIINNPQARGAFYSLLLETLDREEAEELRRGNVAALGEVATDGASLGYRPMGSASADY